jgi:hypothetical protein
MEGIFGSAMASHKRFLPRLMAFSPVLNGPWKALIARAGDEAQHEAIIAITMHRRQRWRAG